MFRNVPLPVRVLSRVGNDDEKQSPVLSIPESEILPEIKKKEAEIFTPENMKK